MNVEIGNEAAQFQGIHKSDLLCSARMDNELTVNSVLVKMTLGGRRGWLLMLIQYWTEEDDLGMNCVTIQQRRPERMVMGAEY